VKRGDRVAVREVPGRWWIAGERKDLLALAPDDADAALYQMTSVHERASCMLRWPEDVMPVETEPDGVLF
jgi:hypothetical protein